MGKLKLILGARYNPSGGLPPTYRLGIEAVGNKLKVAWDTQTTSGLSAPGSLVDAAVGNLPGSWGEDSNFFYPPTSGTVSVSDRLFKKSLYTSGSTVLNLTNCKLRPEALNASYAIGIEGGSTVAASLVDCEVDGTNCGKTFSSVLYQGGGTLNTTDCWVHDVPLNFHDNFGSAGNASHLRTWFQKFGKKALYPDASTADHCEPFHAFGNGTLQLTQCLVDNRGNPITLNTVTSTLAFPEGDGPTPTIILDGVVQVADGDIGGSIYTMQWGPSSADSSISTIRMQDCAIQPGTSTYFSKGTLGRLYGVGNYDLDSGTLLTPTYDGPF